VTSIVYEFTKEDYLEFLIFLRKNNPVLKEKIQNGKYSLIVSLSLSILFAAGGFIRGNSLFGVIFLIIAFFLIYVFWASFASWNIKRRLKNSLDEDKTKAPNSLYNTRKVIFESESMVTVTDFWEEKKYWRSIVRVEKSEKYIYLFESDLRAIPIPKRAFPDNTSFDLFAQTAKEFLAKADSVRKM
jgi:ABC-type transport system involved in Fe-S cluster assembly fused permease/ATPase subunit